MKSMVVVEYIGLIAFATAFLALTAVGYGAQIGAFRVPRKRGLLGRLCLGETLSGLCELRRCGGVSAFLFGERRH